MNKAVLDFDQFTDKALQQTGLLSAADLARSRKLHTFNPGMNLLDVILRYKLITPRHSEIITRKYQEYCEKYTVPVTGLDGADAEEPGRTDMDPSGHVSGNGHDPAAGSVAPDNDTGRPEADKEEKTEPESRAMHNPEKAREIRALFLQARKIGATDLFLNVGSPPIIRKNGRLVPMRQESLDASKIETLLFSILGEEQQAALRREQFLEPCLVCDGHRYRASFVRQRNGWDGSFRLIPSQIPEFEDLGLPLEVAQLAEYREGMVLITGPGGSGKSTTLASYIQLLNRSRSEHIITLEDPIEYVFTSNASHISQRQVGLHTKTYTNALRAALREDPDIIIVGELRDSETVSLAVTAAETGHLVFATLHTTGAAQTIHRLLDLFPPAQRNQIRAQISDSLRGIICQRLIPGKGDEGQCLAVEVMFNISSVANLIREDRIYQIPNMIQINHKRGMRLLDESIQKLLADGRIGHEEAFYFANNKKLFEESEAHIEKGLARERQHAAH
ncbi:PilT/PilU family type 4a pilus ATPase [bacterium]|nr:PilT/PilU family type 4a pilus ATPase [bacterium]